MPLYINTNVSSLNAQRRLLSSSNELQSTFARLSSGLRITRAKDDAAGLAISNRMTSQVRGLTQAIRNANDGISMAQVAEGALDQTTNALQRIRELAVQSANDTNSQKDRWDLQKEVNQLVQEIERIGRDTEFNAQPVLDGTYSEGSTILPNFGGTSTGNAARFHIGANTNQYVEVNIGPATVEYILGDADGGSTMSGTLGWAVPTIQYPFQADGTATGGWDADNIHTPANFAVDIFGGYLDANGNVLDDAAGAASTSTAASAGFEGAEAANLAISQLDEAISRVSQMRSTLGAVESRFESAISNLSNVVENVSAARSRVLDADIAAETAKLTQNSILQQAGTAILAQANQQPQLALQLLG
ncbi:MAG: flagellin FliC [Magnetococcus sp. WYHC-3]